MTPDIYTVPLDLKPPAVTDTEPAPGIRVRRRLREYTGTGVHHILYLPEDWTPERRFPVIAEYPGNGPFSNEHGDVYSGYIEDCSLGYGISGGKGYIWVCLPFINTDKRENQRMWWGDPDADASYAVSCIREICLSWGGDSGAVFLSGFSRGSIACNYIGLRNDEIASLWSGFICHSHYDGVRPWDYPGSDRASAVKRLARLGGRPQFISHEKSVRETRHYLNETCPDGNFTFTAIPYPNHTDTWVLRGIPERERLRSWITAVRNGSHRR